VLTSEWRTSYATELVRRCPHKRLDKGEVFIDPARFVADPDKAQRYPELPYLSFAARLSGLRAFNADTGLAVVRAGIRRSIAGCFSTRPSPNRVRFRTC